MSDDCPPPTSPLSRPRRSSFAGQTFADLFGPGRPRPSISADSGSPPSTSAGTNTSPSPITQAAAQAQRRRLSLTTLGLSGSPNQISPFNSLRGTARRDSAASSNSDWLNESAIEDDSAATQPTAGTTSTAATPFASRMSFGAKAMRDIRTSSGGGGGGGGGMGSSNANGANGRPASIAESSEPFTASTAAINGKSTQPISSRGETKDRGEGFNWSDNLRNRAERTSIVAPAAGPLTGIPNGSGGHSRAESVATMPPSKEMPKAQVRPDHFQERILKGDFYMD